MNNERRTMNGRARRGRWASLRSSFILHPSSFLLLLLAGCADDIDSTYGRRNGPNAASVNGVSVFSSLLEDAGHRVRSTSWLSPYVAEKADVIVWFPTSFACPSKEVRNWLDNWLASAPGRTLIYVGRDYDAGPMYWKKVEPGAASNIAAEIARRAGVLEREFQIERQSADKNANCGWYRHRPNRPPSRVTTLEGAPRWLTGVDPSKVEIELNGRLLAPRSAEVLLQSGGDALVSRTAVGDGQRIIVVNGSFLLNLPLVNHEHRKLAAKLIDEIGEPQRRVVFIQSMGDPLILDEEPPLSAPDSLRILRIAPFDQIFLHLAAAGIIFCFARLPIFGRARTWISDNLADFGQHVAAVGSLLERTRDRAAALAEWQRYRESPRRASSTAPSAHAAAIAGNAQSGARRAARGARRANDAKPDAKE